MDIKLDQLIHKVGDPGEFIKINADKCTGCKRCVVVCPINLWYLEKGKANIRASYKQLWLECGSCWQVCDYGAIEFNFPKGGTGVVFERG